MSTFNDYTVRISAEPSYYGTGCTQQDAERIVENLGNMIRTEFPGIQIERSTGGDVSSATTGPDDSACERIDRWIENNWTYAL